MTEGELMQALYASTQTVVSLFSIFCTITSAYIAGLYLFLCRAPFALRLLAFFLLSVALAFLGGATAIQHGAQDAIFAAWAKLPSPSIPIEVLLNPIQVPQIQGLPIKDIGAAFGWLAALSIYLSLAYMTFLYRWTDEDL
jgi:hypothetical protein